MPCRVRPVTSTGRVTATAVTTDAAPKVTRQGCSSARRPKLVVGFAAETNDVEAHAQAELAKKGCDWIVANDVSVAGTMGGDDNAVSIVSAAGVERWARAPKAEVARRLADRIAEELK